MKTLKFLKQKCDAASKLWAVISKWQTQSRRPIYNQTKLVLKSLPSSTFCSKWMSTIFIPDFSEVSSTRLE